MWLYRLWRRATLSSLIQVLLPARSRSLLLHALIHEFALFLFIEVSGDSLLTCDKHNLSICFICKCVQLFVTDGTCRCHCVSAPIEEVSGRVRALTAKRSGSLRKFDVSPRSHAGSLFALVYFNWSICQMGKRICHSREAVKALAFVIEKKLNICAMDVQGWIVERVGALLWRKVVWFAHVICKRA